MSGKRLLSTPSVASLLVAPVSGGQLVTTANTALAYCPSETGGRRGSLEEAVNLLLYPLRVALPQCDAGPGGSEAEGVDSFHF